MVVKKELFEKIRDKAPKVPGVYVWKDGNGNVLYVGKAINLKNRLLSYTKERKDLFVKTAKFLSLAERLDWIEVRNELEAILLEMNLIRTLKPKYNSLSKDDKRPLFIHFTKDKFPRVRTERIELAGNGDYVGPFPSSRKLKEIMRRLRKIFPYCSCSVRRIRACLYYDLGLCLGVSAEGEDMISNNSKVKSQKSKLKLEIDEVKRIRTQNYGEIGNLRELRNGGRDAMNRVSTKFGGENEESGRDAINCVSTIEERRRQYRRNIRNLKIFLSGKIDKVMKILEKEMREYAEKEEYELAQKSKEQIEAVRQLAEERSSIGEYLQDDIVRNKLRNSQNKFLARVLGLTKVGRIEGYDIAHTGGENSTASMVVFENGLPVTSEYRKFKMKYVQGINDPKMIYETLMRRFNHDEWKMPDVLLIDGGKGQVKAAHQALKEHNINIRIVGLAKRLEQLVFWTGEEFVVESLAMDSPALVLLMAVRDEAHRFTTTFHKKLRERQLLK